MSFTVLNSAIYHLTSLSLSYTVMWEAKMLNSEIQKDNWQDGWKNWAHTTWISSIDRADKTGMQTHCQEGHAVPASTALSARAIPWKGTRTAVNAADWQVWRWSLVRRRAPYRPEHIRCLPSWRHRVTSLAWEPNQLQLCPGGTRSSMENSWPTRNSNHWLSGRRQAGNVLSGPTFRPRILGSSTTGQSGIACTWRMGSSTDAGSLTVGRKPPGSWWYRRRSELTSFNCSITARQQATLAPIRSLPRCVVYSTGGAVAGTLEAGAGVATCVWPGIGPRKHPGPQWRPTTLVRHWRELPWMFWVHCQRVSRVTGTSLLSLITSRSRQSPTLCQTRKQQPWPSCWWRSFS